jgi:hypothetical protein
MNEITQFVENNWESIVAAVGGIVIAARVIVKLTPTPKDDELYAKFIKLLKHFGLYIPLVCLSFLNLSCAGLQVTPDGCVLGTYTANNQTYLAGPCIGSELDENGRNQIDRFQVIWQNHDGQTLRAVYWLESKRKTQIEYRLANGLWLSWDSKSGILIGPVPPEVTAALSGQPEPIAIATPVIALP